MSIKLNIQPFKGGYKVRFAPGRAGVVVLADALELAEFIALKASEVINAKA